jgi:hypothetical protein
VEVELWHDGVPDLFFARLRKIGAHYDEKSGMNAETWEALTQRDMPQRFTVLLHKGTLPSHIQLCKYRETDHGARLIQRLGYMALILIYIPLLSALGGLIPSDVSLLEWYWVGPICAVAGMFFTIAWYNHASVCGRLVLECAYPSLEEGGHHICYVCHSKAANVIEQLNAWDRHAGEMKDLILGLVENVNQRVVDLEDIKARLEHEADQRDRETVHQVTRNLNRQFWFGQGTTVRSGVSPAVMISALVLVAMAVALVMYYWR